MNYLDQKVCFWTVGKKDTLRIKEKKKMLLPIFNILDAVILWKL